MINRNLIGHTIGPKSIDFERQPLALFCKAIGETNPLFTDIDKARAAGAPDLRAPPTYLFALKTAVIHPMQWVTLIGMANDLGRLFHAEQSFEYHRPAYVGDRLTYVEKLVDIYDKKDGALIFLVTETSVTNQRNESLATLRYIQVATNR